MDALSTILTGTLAILSTAAFVSPWIQKSFHRFRFCQWNEAWISQLQPDLLPDEVGQILLRGLPAKQIVVVLREMKNDSITLLTRTEPTRDLRRQILHVENLLLRTSLASAVFSSDGMIDDSYVMRFQCGSSAISSFAVCPQILPARNDLECIAAKAQSALENMEAGTIRRERRKHPRNQKVQTMRTQVDLPISPYQMVTRVAHDLRLPMTNLELTLERLQNETGDASARDLAKRAAKQLQVLESLTHSVVHVHSGRTPDTVDEMESDLGLETQTALESFADACRMKQIEIVVQMPDPFRAACRPVRLRRILLNLISNAVRYASSPGRITIRGEAAEDFVQWEIQDSGPGLGCSNDLFFGLSRQNLGRTGGGFGIGLASARDLARESGGDLTGLPSESGARFLLVLPAGACLGVPGHDPSEKYNGAPLGPLRAL